ncbi:MAG: ABC transporter ATP-binding protein [Erysipelotrichales bacterium]|nr:ABC transporter ATP-binding protein [Erysipelotrichales bacterium]
MALLEFKNVTWKYRGAKEYALNNVNLSLNEGQIVGLLGPNGSGKTTIIKLIAGLLKNFDGEILINEKHIGPESKAIVSYLPDSTYLKENLVINDVIKMFADFYQDFDTNKMLSMLKTMNISQFSVIKSLSKGNKEKLQLALVLSRDAKIYLLDEPIGGVDPAQRDFIITTILNNYAANSLVIISTHLIEDIEGVLNRAIFIQNGSVVIDDTKENIVNTHDNKTLNEVFKEEFKC